MALAAETKRAEQLTAALANNRRIGIAVGLVMAQHSLTDTESFEALRRTSMNTNLKLAQVAEDVICRRGLISSPASTS